MPICMNLFAPVFFNFRRGFQFQRVDRHDLQFDTAFFTGNNFAHDNVVGDLDVGITFRARCSFHDIAPHGEEAFLVPAGLEYLGVVGINIESL